MKATPRLPTSPITAMMTAVVEDGISGLCGFTSFSSVQVTEQ
jgi:hypothetical protein